MSAGSRAEALANRVRQAWHQALQYSAEGDTEKAVAAMNEAEAALGELLNPAGSLAGAPDQRRELLLALQQEAGVVSQTVQSTLTQVAQALREIGGQRLQVRAARSYLGRVPRQARRLDEHA